MFNRKRFVSMVTGLTVTVLAWPAVAGADTTLIPCGDTSALAGAVAAANSSSGEDTIVLAPGCEYEISATLGVTSATADLTVVGNGSTINGGDAVRIFLVSSGARLELSDLRLVNGLAPSGGNGGAIEQSGGEVILDRVTVTGSEALSGGGIYSSATLTVVDSTVSGNTATSNGGGGGGIYINSGGNLQMVRSTSKDNRATGPSAMGGGLYVNGGGTATLTNSTLAGNRAESQGGGTISYGALSVANSTIAANATGGYGGGMFSGGGSLQVDGSIIAGNSSDDGVLASVRDCYMGIVGAGSSNLTTSSIGASSCAGAAGFTLVADLALALSPLPAANGGPTETVAIGDASAARDGVNAGCPDTDQRGFPRGATCDIGAYQFGGLIDIADVTATEGDSGTTLFEFPVTLLPGQDDTVTVDYEVAHGSTDDDDFAGGLPTGGQIVFDPGETTKTIEVAVSGDTEVEADETFTVTLSGLIAEGADPVALGRATATGTIVNDDFPPSLLSVTVEGPGQVTSTPAGIECRAGGAGGCEAGFDGGATVSLSAELDPGALFGGWTGCDQIVAGDCIVEMTHDRSVTAQFASIEPGCTAGIGDSAELVAAIGIVNSNGQDDTITLAPDCTYDLSAIGTLSVEPDGGHSLTIQGDDSTLDGADEAVVLIARPGSSLTLDGVTVKDGWNPGSSFNIPGTDGYGGGLVVDEADVTILDSEFAGNRAGQVLSGDLIGSGGAIAVLDGSLEIRRSSFSLNESGWGGAIANQTSDLTIEDSSFDGNLADFYGGAIDTYVVTFWGDTGFTEITGSTFSGNRAELDGGALNVTDGQMSVVNSTIHGNWARQGAGAIRVNRGGDDSGAEVINTTMYGNTTQFTSFASGITGGDRVSVTNSILAGAESGRHSCPSNPSAPANALIVSDSLSDDPRCEALGFTLVEGDLDLGGLAANGGPTETVALLSGSPALDAADQAVCDAELPENGSGEPVDQRGFQRGQNPPNPCDIGAYEANRMTIEGVSQNEGDSGSAVFEFPVELDAPALTDVTVQYETEDGTAVAPQDYTASSGTLTIDQGETVGYVAVSVHGNTEFTGDRDFSVVLSGADGAAILGDGSATGVIVEGDDPLLSVSVSGSGDGRVTSDDGLIDCGDGNTGCERRYPEGSEVTLTAHSGGSSDFTGWSEACEGTGACVITLDGNLDVEAMFELKQHTPPDPPTPSDSSPIPSAPVPSASPPLPPNNFRFGKVMRRPNRGITVVPVSLPGPGRLVLTGKHVKRVVRSVRGAATVRLPVSAKGPRAVRKLRSTGRLKLAGRITFTPVGGEPRSIAGRVWLVKARPR